MRQTIAVRFYARRARAKQDGLVPVYMRVGGITKKMTFHTSPHTPATTVTLSNGVPIETVGKMLGQLNLKTTQHYARILEKKVSEDLGVLRAKFRSAAVQDSKAWAVRVESSKT